MKANAKSTGTSPTFPNAQLSAELDRLKKNLLNEHSVVIDTTLHQPFNKMNHYFADLPQLYSKALLERIATISISQCTFRTVGGNNVENSPELQNEVARQFTTFYSELASEGVSGFYENVVHLFSNADELSIYITKLHLLLRQKMFFIYLTSDGGATVERAMVTIKTIEENERIEESCDIHSVLINQLLRSADNLEGEPEESLNTTGNIAPATTVKEEEKQPQTTRNETQQVPLPVITAGTEAVAKQSAAQVANYTRSMMAVLVLMIACLYYLWLKNNQIV